jgi:hypothetical protein
MGRTVLFTAKWRSMVQAVVRLYRRMWMADRIDSARAFRFVIVVVIVFARRLSVCPGLSVCCSRWCDDVKMGETAKPEHQRKTS